MIYRPNHRALAIGEIWDVQENTDEQDEDRQVSQSSQNYCISARHTISGFFGCSGGMVCTFDNGEPKVVGICKSSLLSLRFNTNIEKSTLIDEFYHTVRGQYHRRNFNQFMKLTEAGIEWLGRIVKGEISVPTVGVDL